jgi:hypothetical protein
MVNGAQNFVSTLFTSWNEHTCEMLFDTKCVSRDSTTDLRIADRDYKAGGVNQGTDGRDLGADIDEIEAETGPWGADVIAGIPPFRERSGRTVSAGNTGAVLSYLPLSADMCRVKIWDNSRYSGAAAVDTGDSETDVIAGRRVLRIAGLSPSTTYYVKRRCEAGVDVFSFATLAADQARSIQVNGASVPAATAVIESGVSPGSLTPGTPVPCAAGCALTVPAEHMYYRVAYRDSSGATVARGDVTAAR